MTFLSIPHLNSAIKILQNFYFLRYVYDGSLSIIGEKEEHSFIEEIGGKSKNIRFIKLNTPQAIYSIIDLLSHNSDYC